MGQASRPHSVGMRLLDARQLAYLIAAADGGQVVGEDHIRDAVGLGEGGDAAAV